MEMRVGWGKAVPLPPVPLYSGTGVPTGPLTGEIHNKYRALFVMFTNSQQSTFTIML
jgi:hypothetical protein